MITARKEICRSREKQKKYYNRGVKQLPPLKPGNTVRIEPTAVGEDKWEKGIVTERKGLRQYELLTERGTKKTRNRRHLILTKSRQPVIKSRDNACDEALLRTHFNH